MLMLKTMFMVEIGCIYIDDDDDGYDHDDKDEDCVYKSCVRRRWGHRSGLDWWLP